MSEKNIIKTARFHHITAGMRFAYTHSNPAFGGTADNLKTHLSGSSPTGRNPTYCLSILKELKKIVSKREMDHDQR